MERIVVGVDGSEESRKAVALAASLSRSLHATLVVAHVMSYPGAHDPPPVVSAEYSWWFSSHRDWAETLVREAVLREARPGLSIETRVLTGDPAHALSRLALEERVSLVVVGHRGRGLAERLLIGSVADRLLQMCDRPVLVSR